MPLIIAPENKDLKIVKINTDSRVKKYLESLGIAVDSIIKILQRTSGSVILFVKESRLALDHDIATKILVA